MTERRATFAEKVVPSLLVRDLPETLAFYARLGFHQTGSYPETEPTWAEVARDGAVLQLYTEPPHGTATEPVMSGTLYLHPSSVADLAEELRGRVDFAWGPEVMDYGMLELAVRDPNGYLIAFTEPADETPAAPRDGR